MATARGRRFDREALGRAGALVACCTLALTASFVGLVALVSGQAVGAGDRLPFYVLTMAAAFVVAIVLFETFGHDGRTVLASAVGVAVATLLLVGLGSEGFIHAVRHPQQVIASHLVFYFLAAAMLATGFGFWAVQHWQELRVDVRSGSRGGFGR